MTGPVVEHGEPAVEQQEQALAGLALLGDRIDDLDHRARGEDTIEVVAQVGERVDDRHLGDGVEVRALVQHDVDVGERLEAPTEAALGLPHALRDGADLAVVGAEDHDDAMGLPERVAAQHDALVTPKCHDR